MFGHPRDHSLRSMLHSNGRPPYNPSSPPVRATIPEEILEEMQLFSSDVLDGGWRNVMILRKLEQQLSSSVL